MGGAARRWQQQQQQRSQTAASAEAGHLPATPVLGNVRCLPWSAPSIQGGKWMCLFSMAAKQTGWLERMKALTRHMAPFQFIPNCFCLRSPHYGSHQEMGTKEGGWPVYLALPCFRFLCRKALISQESPFT